MQHLEDHVTELTNQTVLVRCNFDVPLDNAKVGDTTRIEDALPTLKLLRENQARVILMAHAGRPDGTFKASATLKPVGQLLTELLHEPVKLIDYQTDYHQLKLTADPVQLLDNLRFYPEEEGNDPAFSAYLSGLGQAYVNEAFANCHREHASMVGVPQLMPGHTFAGLSLVKEMTVLTQISEHPDRPFVVVIGGAKVETKEPLVMALAPKANQVLVGGKIAVDLKTNPALPGNVVLAELTPDQRDITETSARQFADLIRQAKTVMWNGTMGVFEEPDHQLGTRLIAEAIDQTNAYTVIGGGDTESALTQLKLEAHLKYISTGGGAMLTFLSDGHLVALDALN